MSGAANPEPFFVGWDVGGWNCDRNAKSRDAVVILDAGRQTVGEPWRGNLRECIAGAATTTEWLKAIFSKCRAAIPETPVEVTMAIDTPLGFPDEFVNLVAKRECVEPDRISGMNRYLFRHTERHIFQQGRAPLSAIKDMIGSQATKGMHVLAKFAPSVESCGVWWDGKGFRAIETYPAACQDSKVVGSLLSGCSPLGHDDLDDARTCAVVAYLFATERRTLEPPGDDCPRSEGWIWVPRIASADEKHTTPRI